MEIGNREYGFKMTVGASIQIAKLCPGNDLQKIGEAIGYDYIMQAESMARIVVALNSGYADAEAFEGRNAERLTIDDVLSLSPEIFAELSSEAIKTIIEDTNGKIEVETGKKAGAEG